MTQEQSILLLSYLSFSLRSQFLLTDRSTLKMGAEPGDKPEPVSISPLLQRLAYPATQPPVEAAEIASAFALIFEDRLSVVQTAALLTLLHSTGKDREADVIAKCSHRMREAAWQVERLALKKAVKARGLGGGKYRGGLVSSDSIDRTWPF